MKLCLQFGKNIGFASGDDLYVAAIGVADPTAQTKLCGLPLDKPAKTNALHASFD